MNWSAGIVSDFSVLISKVYEFTVTYKIILTLNSSVFNPSVLHATRRATRQNVTHLSNTSHTNDISVFKLVLHMKSVIPSPPKNQQQQKNNNNQTTATHTHTHKSHTQNKKQQPCNKIRAHALTMSIRQANRALSRCRDNRAPSMRSEKLHYTCSN